MISNYHEQTKPIPHSNTAPLYPNPGILQNLKLEAKRITGIPKAPVAWVTVVGAESWPHQFLAVWTCKRLNLSVPYVPSLTNGINKRA